MTLTLELKPEEVEALKSYAESVGVDMATVLHNLIAQIPSTTDRPLYETMTLDEWESVLDELSEDIDPNIPPLSDESLRRENLYADRVR